MPGCAEAVTKVHREMQLHSWDSASDMVAENVAMWVVFGGQITAKAFPTAVRGKVLPVAWIVKVLAVSLACEVMSDGTAVITTARLAPPLRLPKLPALRKERVAFLLGLISSVSVAAAFSSDLRHECAFCSAWIVAAEDNLGKLAESCFGLS